MAEIFLASHSGPEGFKKHLAIKRILPYLNDDSDFVTMFLDEARLVARFSHPNIVQIFELGRVEGSYFLAMEFVNGVSLSKLMKACRKKNITMPLEYAVKVISYACEGLEYAHSFTDSDGTPLNLIHRDVSPQNLMLSYDGVVKVLDFGIAKAASNSYQTRTSSLKGKAAYMSPEQIIQKGGLDRRSDIFSLGIVLFELVTGHRPFRGDTELELMMSIVKKPAPDPRTFNETIPTDIVRILSRALEKNRQKRYQSSLQMRQALEEFLLNRRILVDNHTLGSFARDVLPPGTMGVGSSNLTPSGPSFVEAAPGAQGGSVIPARTPTAQRLKANVHDHAQDLPTQHTPSSQLKPMLESSSIPIEVDDSILDTVHDGEILKTPEQKNASAWKKTMVIISLVLITAVGIAFLVLSNKNPDQDEQDSQSPPKIVTKAQRDKNQIAKDLHQNAKPISKHVVAKEPPQKTELATHTGSDTGQDTASTQTPKQETSQKSKEKPSEKRTERPKRKVHKRKRPKPQKSTTTGHGSGKTKVAVTQGFGNLKVDTRPWTSVSIDGTSYGTTPLGPVKLKAGIHKLLLVNKSKGISLKKTINILPGQAQTIREKFGQGTVLPFVKPFGEVFVDGASMGITPLDKPIKLYEGIHKIRVVCSRTGRTASKTVRINAGDALTIKFDLR